MKNAQKPNGALPFAATNVSSAITGGPTHGAANTPTTSPDRYIAMNPLPDVPPNLLVSQ